MLAEITEIEYLIEQLEQKYSIKFVKRGKNYFALCPFHAEKTPSFSVYEKRTINEFSIVYYYCFGCHKGGRVADLLGLDKRQMTVEEKIKLQVIKLIHQYYKKYINFLLNYSTVLEEIISELKVDEFDEYIELLAERAHINTMLNFFYDENIDKDIKIEHFLNQKVPQTQTPQVAPFVLSKNPPDLADLVLQNIKKNKELLKNLSAISMLKAMKEVIYEYF